jgi:hypothetical protein
MVENGSVSEEAEQPDGGRQSQSWIIRHLDELRTDI